jgi:hypothetical protein
MVIGKESAPYATKNYNQIDPKEKFAKMNKPLVPEKVKEKSNLGPASYNNLDSFKKATLPKERFYISKSKYDNFIV